mgnify:CR=1 FL=1
MTLRHAHTAGAVVLILITPLLSQAENASMIINTVSTTAESGPDGESSVSVSQTTVVNGERTEYNFSERGTGSIEHTVSIDNGVVTTYSATTAPPAHLSESEVPSPRSLDDSSPTPMTDTNRGSKDEMNAWLRAWFNTFFAYVGFNPF